MKILVIGSGGREHALAWRLAREDRVQKVLVAPGNDGMASTEGLECHPNVRTLEAWLELAQSEGVAFTVVGPEAPLAAGVVDLFRAHGLKIFGPTKAAAQLESSKDFAKQFMQRHGIPTAQAQTFTDPTAAHAYLEQRGAPIVIKADGLAAGKGVVVATDLQQAHDAIDFMLGDGQLGQAGARVLIEDFLAGEEASFIVMVDGRNVLALASSQDHKRLGDGDSGPNTGGMGAYSPAPVITPALHARIMREVIMPTVLGMQADGITYTGFLYAGVMIDDQGQARVLEFNCRLGDPETQPIMFRLKGDLVEIFEKAIDGQLDQAEIDWDRRTAIGVVMASAGYPGESRLGDVISGLPNDSQECVVFHAATRRNADGELCTAGGRVLCVTALGDSVKMAQKRAYDTVAGIHFAGAQYRRDIGWRALTKPNQGGRT